MNLTLIERAGEPRIADLDLADHLGFVDRRMIHRLVQRHVGALKQFGDIPVTVTENPDPLGRGRPGRAYLLNRKQALYICAKSETPRAAEVTISMVEVFDAYLEGKTVKVKEHWRRTPAPPTQWDPQYLPVANEGVKIEQIAGRMHKLTLFSSNHMCLMVAARYIELLPRQAKALA